MTEPTEDEFLRAKAALMPFVPRWHLPLNPEDVAELAYAVLRYARSDLSLDQIYAAVGRQIDEAEQRARELGEAMGESLRNKAQR